MFEPAIQSSRGRNFSKQGRFRFLCSAVTLVALLASIFYRRPADPVRTRLLAIVRHYPHADDDAQTRMAAEVEAMGNAAYPCLEDLVRGHDSALNRAYRNDFFPAMQHWGMGWLPEPESKDELRSGAIELVHRLGTAIAVSRPD